MSSSIPARLFLCFLVVSCCCYVMHGQMVIDCCLTVTNRAINHKRVRAFYQQVAGQGCNIDATVLETIKGQKLCAPSGEQWVVVLRQSITNQRKKCILTNNKGRRCMNLLKNRS